MFDINMACSTLSCFAGDYANVMTGSNVWLAGIFFLFMIAMWSFMANFPRALFVFLGVLGLGILAMTDLAKQQPFTSLFVFMALVFTVILFYAVYKTIKNYIQ